MRPLVLSSTLLLFMLIKYTYYHPRGLILSMLMWFIPSCFNACFLNLPGKMTLSFHEYSIYHRYLISKHAISSHFLAYFISVWNKPSIIWSDFHQKLNIQQAVSSPYHLQSKAQVESTIKLVKSQWKGYRGKLYTSSFVADLIDTSRDY